MLEGKCALPNQQIGWDYTWTEGLNTQQCKLKTQQQILC